MREIPEIIYLLDEQGMQKHRKFLQEYRELRRREGRGSDDPEYYLHLPDGEFGRERKSEWKMRKESLIWLQGELRKRFPDQSLDILDAGAGNCWLTRYLAEWGHRVTALDLNDDRHDGLGAGENYLQELPITFDRVVADFVDLPWGEGTFDLLIYNGSIHYAEDLYSVIAEGLRILRKDGSLIILDSPIYHDHKSGTTMVKERGGHGRAGFLTYGTLNELARLFSLRIFVNERPRRAFDRVKRRLIALKLGREPASMPWIVLTKS